MSRSSGGWEPSQWANTMLKLTACLLACWMGVQAAGPFMAYGRMRAANARLEKRRKEMERQNIELRAQAALIGRPDGLEGDARRLGYLDRGQAPLVFAEGQTPR